MLVLKYLSNSTMTSLGKELLDPGRFRPLLEARPTSKAILPKLEAALQEIERSTDTHAAHESSLLDIELREHRADAIHDRKARGTFLLLSGLAEVDDDEHAREELLHLREALFPSDLGFTQLSYREEARNADRVRATLTRNPTLSALLHEVSLPGGQTLWKIVNDWLEAGRLLGALEEQRSQIERGHSSSGDAARDSGLQARNAWMRAVRALLATLDLDDFSEQEREQLVRPLRDASEQSLLQARESLAEEGAPSTVLGGAAER